MGVNSYLQVFSSVVISYIFQENLDFILFFNILLPYSLGPKARLSWLVASSHSKGENLILELEGGEAMQRATGKPIQQSVFLKSRIQQQENKGKLFFIFIYLVNHRNSIQRAIFVQTLDNKNKNISPVKEEKSKYKIWIFKKRAQ